MHHIAKDYEIMKIKLSEAGDEYQHKFKDISEEIKHQISPKEISHKIAQLPSKISTLISSIPDLVQPFPYNSINLEPEEFLRRNQEIILRPSGQVRLE